jgi:hypothetical protein
MIFFGKNDKTFRAKVIILFVKVGSFGKSRHFVVHGSKINANV